MKISVIIPAYNEEQYLGKTLEAVLAQDYPDFEVIVVDNASTDGTAKIARSFQKAKLVSESRKGTMSACERGRTESKGDILVRMDADCVPDKDWLSKGAAFFNDPKVSGAGGPYDYYDYGTLFRYLSLQVQKWIYTPISAIAQFFGAGAIMNGGNSFMRASSLEAVGGFNTDIVFYGDDTDTARRLTKVGKVIFSPHLTIKTSARRFKKEGILNLEFKYLISFIMGLFFLERKKEGNARKIVQ